MSLPARRSLLPGKLTPFRCLRLPSGSSACPRPSVPIMVCLLPVQIPSSISPSSRFGGSALASRSSASSPATQQNGRHERMHLTLKLETTKPAGKNFLQQQAKFDDFIECFNNERPHQALNMRTPAECYVPSTRPYAGLPNLDYPFHDKTVTVTSCGRICFNRQKINLSVVFAGQNVGIKQVSEDIWLVTFMDYDLGYFDHETCRLEPVANPFGPRVLQMSRLEPSRVRSKAASERASIAP